MADMTDTALTALSQSIAAVVERAADIIKTQS